MGLSLGALQRSSLCRLIEQSIWFLKRGAYYRKNVAFLTLSAHYIKYLNAQYNYSNMTHLEFNIEEVVEMLRSGDWILSSSPFGAQATLYIRRKAGSGSVPIRKDTIENIEKLKREIKNRANRFR